MPNPDGVNGFDRFRSEAVYGAKKKMTDLVKGAPVSPSLNNTARRSQRRAASGQKAGPEPMVLPPAEVSLLESAPPAADLASVWGEIAAHPEASDLVREYAQMVVRGAGS